MLPVTIPPVTDALLLLALQLPPVVPSVKVIVLPTHTLVVPVIVPAVRVAPTVTDSVVVAVPQLLLTVYFIVSVPALTAVTTPDVFMVAWLLVMLHVPPLPLSV